MPASRGRRCGVFSSAFAAEVALATSIETRMAVTTPDIDEHLERPVGNLAVHHTCCRRLPDLERASTIAGAAVAVPTVLTRVLVEVALRYRRERDAWEAENALFVGHTRRIDGRRGLLVVAIDVVVVRRHDLSIGVLALDSLGVVEVFAENSHLRFAFEVSAECGHTNLAAVLARCDISRTVLLDLTLLELGDQVINTSLDGAVDDFFAAGQGWRRERNNARQGEQSEPEGS